MKLSENIYPIMKEYFYLCKLEYQEFVEYVEKKYSEDHRVFHTIEHVNNILEAILQSDMNSDEQFILILSAIYHDIEYNIGDSNNEEKSAEIMLSQWCYDYTIVEAYNMILSTKTLELNCTKLEYIFKLLDCDILFSKDCNKLIDYENKIRKEFSKINFIEYKKARIEFLEKAYVFSGNEL
jgi:predicted metal-dependent HD superfamily phosphohydrolase